MQKGQDILSTRGQHVRDFPNFVIQYASRTVGNLYHKTTNPNGLINFGVAENALCDDILTKKLSQPAMNEHKPAMQYYFQFKGIESFRRALAHFLTKRFRAARDIHHDNVYVTSGVGAGIDLLGHMFFEAGDSCLVLAPYYGAISANLGIRAEIKCIPVQLSSNEEDGCAPFEVNISKMNSALEEATKRGERVRGVFLMNPHNPTGDVLTRQKLVEILDFCAEHDLHIILDEIYALSPIGPETEFHSVLSIKDLPCPEKTHFLWGFSKDFGLSGFRCGVVHTLHPNFGQDSAHLIYMAAVPYIVQEKLRMLISDENWLDQSFFPTNIRRLQKSYSYLSRQLQALHIPFHAPQGGLFVWVNLSKAYPIRHTSGISGGFRQLRIYDSAVMANFGTFVMRPKEDTARDKLIPRKLFLPSQDQAGEQEVFFKLLNGGVYCLPGSALFFEEAGWFRLTLAHPIQYLKTGLQRFRELLHQDSDLQSRVKGEKDKNGINGLGKCIIS